MQSLIPDAGLPLATGKEMETMFGVDWTDPETLWLNVTNLMLGIVTLLAVMLVGASLVWEFAGRWAAARNRRWAAAGDSLHVLPVPELGLTMADGGEAVDNAPTEDTGPETPAK